MLILGSGAKLLFVNLNMVYQRGQRTRLRCGMQASLMMGLTSLPNSLSSRQVDNCFGLICVPFPSSKGQCI